MSAPGSPQALASEAPLRHSHTLPGSHGSAGAQPDPGRCRYAAQNARLDLSAETRLNADSEEMARLQERRESGAQASSAPHSVCELFFLTARAAHLGYVKMVTDQPHIQRARPVAVPSAGWPPGCPGRAPLTALLG